MNRSVVPRAYLVEARDVVKSFGQTPALRGASVAVSSGEIFAIMGPSGSGKSTLLHCLAGIFGPDLGEVWFDGRRLDTLGVDIGERWRELAALWQGHADGKCLVFGDIHAAMAELRSGQETLAERRLKAMHETEASGVEAAGLYRTVGIPIVEGLSAFHRHAWAEAVELLLSVRSDLWQIGGSHAQQDVLE